MSPALAGRLSTTAPPGKPPITRFLIREGAGESEVELENKDARMEAESGAMCFDDGGRGHEPRKGRASEAGKGKETGVSLESSEGR